MKKLVLTLSLCISSFISSSFAGLDVCKTKYTLMHLSESECYLIDRNLQGESFQIKASLVSKTLADKHKRETIVVIPGGPGESHEPLRRALQEREFLNTIWHGFDKNIVMFDPRGTGASKLSQETNTYGPEVLSTENFVADLKAVIEKVSPQKAVILMAHSAGGEVALKLAAKHPGLVKKIILLASSPSSRLMALTNLEFFKKSFPSFLDAYFSSLPKSEEVELREKVSFIEEHLREQLKARTLKQYEHEEFSSKVLTRSFKSPLDFRNVLRISLESESQMKPNTRIRKIYDLIKEAEQSSGLEIIPSELRALKLDPTPIAVSKHSSKQWIQRIIMCAEGLSKEELSTPLFYDGRTMNYFCDGIHSPNEVRLDYSYLKKVFQPVLIVAGDKDTQVPLSYQKEAYQNLPNATFEIVRGGGHTFFKSHPMEFYRALERFF